ncbi:MAG: polysaccharide biosynthesis protein PslG, partial [Solirubrobacteraceae bacterium]|nr:polysaccharide biosynthesis protein PslG [Solirubrobacteraceae bacterium]
MRMTPRRLLLAIVMCALSLPTAGATQASAAPGHFSNRKAIWGPVTRDGKSQFPIYHDLGAGIWQSTLNWRDTTPSRPAHPRDPADPAYHWPAELDTAVSEAAKYHIRITLLVMSTPAWANGGQPYNWVPTKISDYADFLQAAARRYPSVKLWMVWGEPSRRANFMPETPERQGSHTLTAKQAAAPRYYARMLDASYGALKSVRSSNVVIGGNTFTSGDITPYNWVKYMRLPNGKRPRLDLYGHNPFTGRRPGINLYQDQQVVDISDLPRFTKFLD